MMSRQESANLDRWITGNYGEDFLSAPDGDLDEFDPECEKCGHRAFDHPTVVLDGRDQVVCPTPDPADYDPFWNPDGTCRSCGKFGNDHEEDDEGGYRCWPDED